MAGQHFSPVAALLFVALLGFSLYRRYRRTVGRQPLVPRRLMFQVGLLAVATLLFLVPSLSHPLAAGAALAGLIVGGLVGLGGLSLTRFERAADRDYYTPNTLLGLAVFAVFLARIAYKFMRVQSQIQTLSAAGQPPPGAFSGLTSSPLTAAALLMVLGYYLVYEGGLLLWVRRNPPGQEVHGGFGRP